MSISWTGLEAELAAVIAEFGETASFARRFSTQAGSTMGESTVTLTIKAANIDCSFQDDPPAPEQGTKYDERGNVIEYEAMLFVADSDADIQHDDLALIYDSDLAGAGGVGAAGSFTVSGAGWPVSGTNSYYGLEGKYLVDASGSVFKINSNSATVLTLDSGTPANGAYSIRQAYRVAYIARLKTHLEVFLKRDD